MAGTTVVTPPLPQSAGRQPAREPVVSAETLFVALFGLLVNCWMAWMFAQKGLYGQTDALFDMDTYVTFNAVSSPARHPLINALLMPGRFLHLAWEHLDGSGTSWRTLFVLSLPPLTGFIKTLVLGRCLRLIGVVGWAAIVVLLVDICSLSHLIFYSLPESFTLAGLGIQLLLLAFVVDATRRKVHSTQLWIGATALSLGATVTNAISAALVWLWAHSAKLTRARIGRYMELVRGAMLCASILVISVLIARSVPRWGDCVGVEHRPSRYSKQGLPRVPSSECLALPSPFQEKFAGSFLCIKPEYLGTEFARASIYAFTGPEPQLFQAGVGVHCSNTTPSRVSLLSPRSWSTAWLLPALVFGLALFAGIHGWLTQQRRGYLVLGACSSVVLWNGVLHTIYSGGDGFLYSLHWQPALLIVIAGAAFGHTRVSRLLGMTALVAVLIMECIGNTRVLAVVLGNL